MASLTDFQNQVADRARRAAEMKQTLVEPFREEDGFILPNTKAEAQKMCIRDRI